MERTAHDDTCNTQVQHLQGDIWKEQHMTTHVTHRYSICRETYGKNSTLKYPSAQASQVRTAVGLPGCHRNCTSMVPSVKRNCMANVLQSRTVLTS